MEKASKEVMFVDVASQ